MSCDNNDDDTYDNDDDEVDNDNADSGNGSVLVDFGEVQ